MNEEFANHPLIQQTEPSEEPETNQAVKKEITEKRRSVQPAFEPNETKKL